MRKLDKAIKLALFGAIMGMSGTVSAADYEGTADQWSGVVYDGCRMLEVDVRFEGTREKCLEMQDEDFYFEDGVWSLDSDAEAFFATEETDYYGYGTGVFYCDEEEAWENGDRIGELDSSTDWGLLKFDAKWTGAAQGNAKPGHKGNKGNAETIEVSFKDLGDDPLCD